LVTVIPRRRWRERMEEDGFWGWWMGGCSDSDSGTDLYKSVERSPVGVSVSVSGIHTKPER
jgi:hypothetical protein